MIEVEYCKNCGCQIFEYDDEGEPIFMEGVEKRLNILNDEGGYDSFCSDSCSLTLGITDS